MRVGVRLQAAPGRIGDYLADVIALEAAGADALWLDAGPEGSVEPWILLGAIAASTHRIRLGVDCTSAPGWATGADVLGRLSVGRVVLAMPPGRRPKSGARQASPAPPILIRCGTRDEARRSARGADGVILPAGHDELLALRSEVSQDAAYELWADVSIPADRAGWVDMVAAFDAAGATGVSVPWDPRLIDLLRGAGEPDDRTDLLIATG
jgi:alkanesulfonate monooxygenase SsuD/methylene tetrahydromethanopterin reductase-like flavin-dependent oxidoreductase (luciferase family)